MPKHSLTITETESTSREKKVPHIISTYTLHPQYLSASSMIPNLEFAKQQRTLHRRHPTVLSGARTYYYTHKSTHAATSSYLLSTTPRKDLDLKEHWEEVLALEIVANWEIFGGEVRRECWVAEKELEMKGEREADPDAKDRDEEEGEDVVAEDIGRRPGFKKAIGKLFSPKRGKRQRDSEYGGEGLEEVETGFLDTEGSK